MSGNKVFRGDRDVAAAAEMIHIRFVGVIDQPRDSLFPMHVRSVQCDYPWSLAVGVQRDSQVSVRSLVVFNCVANQLPGVLAIHHHRVVYLQVQWRLCRLILVAEQIHVALLENRTSLLSLRGRFNPVCYIIP